MLIVSIYIDCSLGITRVLHLLFYLKSLVGVYIKDGTDEWHILWAMNALPSPVNTAPALSPDTIDETVATIDIESSNIEKEPLIAEFSELKIDSKVGEPLTSNQGFTNGPSHDITAIYKIIDYDDFIEYLCRVISSDIWIVEIAIGNETQAVDEENAVLSTNREDIHLASLLCDRLNKWLPKALDDVIPAPALESNEVQVVNDSGQ
jgi:hypothetical protein